MVGDTPRIVRDPVPDVGEGELASPEETDQPANTGEPNGFFPPTERSEGFFELDASPEGNNQGKAGAEEGAQR